MLPRFRNSGQIFTGTFRNKSLVRPSSHHLMYCLCLTGGERVYFYVWMLCKALYTQHEWFTQYNRTAATFSHRPADVYAPIHRSMLSVDLLFNRCNLGPELPPQLSFYSSIHLHTYLSSTFLSVYWHICHHLPLKSNLMYRYLKPLNRFFSFFY